MTIVLTNLVSNAVKYTRTRDKPVVEIGQTVKDGKPVVYVRDNGVGFDMKYADKLFGVFQRLHRAEEFEGTGVGLATVQRIIRKHDGTVWAEASPDKGATFFFTLGSGNSGEETQIE
jgi:light-regulated signal transduction histidine kinase (bacteriophytochrome)